MGKKLTKLQLQQLRDWLDGFSLLRNIPISKMHRDLSDGVIFAQTLKEIYPKLIDIHNYSRSSSIKLKRNNWDTLNNKLLKKLGMQQNSATLDGISKSISGYIEQLLYKIMVYEKSEQKNLSESQSQCDESCLNDEILLVNVNKQIGDAIVQVPQKMILFSIHQGTLREMKEKEKTIEVLSQKVVHLENIIGLKTERIEELCGQIKDISNRNFLNVESLSC